MEHFKWFLVVFFSLTLMFISTGSFFKLWNERDEQRALIAANEAAKELSIRMENERLKQERINLVNSKKRNEALNKKNKEIQLAKKRQKQKIQSALDVKRENQKTCDFWRSEYRKNKSDKALGYMQSSCKRASSFLN